VAHYGATLPEQIQPTWFFASMALLDHLRDCPQLAADGKGFDYSDELRKIYSADFLNHPRIYIWYNEHALIERHFLAQEELE
jgi:hypothetical protein